MRKIVYPYLPASRDILYVPENHVCMLLAKMVNDQSGCSKQPTSAVIADGYEIWGIGSNAARKVVPCPRGDNPSETNYGPCKFVCMQEGHAEITAIKDAMRRGHDLHGTDLYLYGHWYCCEDCWNKIIAAGITRVFLLEGSWERFKK